MHYSSRKRESDTKGSSDAGRVAASTRAQTWRAGPPFPWLQRVGCYEYEMLSSYFHKGGIAAEKKAEESFSNPSHHS